MLLVGWLLIVVFVVVGISCGARRGRWDWLIDWWLVGWVCGGYNNLMEEIWLELYYTYLRIILSMCVCYSQEVIFYERTIIFTITHTRTQIQTHALRTQQTEWWENIQKGYQSAREWAGERAKAQDPEENCPDCYTTFPCPFSTFALTKTEHSLNHIIMHTERASKQQLNGCRVLCPQYIVFVLIFAITLNLLKLLLTFNGLFCWQSIRNNY